MKPLDLGSKLHLTTDLVQEGLTEAEPWHNQVAEPDDHFHDECGVVAIFGHPEAANLAYLALHALQHRGQESAGIVSSDGTNLYNHKAMGLVQQIFTRDVIGNLPGHAAIGHTRYSTAGQSAMLNAQPFCVQCSKGQLAVAHNGNLTNAIELRTELENLGSIFQGSSDTEVVLHLMAGSRAPPLLHALRESLLRLEGAFSLVLLGLDRIIVARDQRGFRPLVYGQLESPTGTAHVFASETCALDLIGAKLVSEVSPGEMVTVYEEGVFQERFAPELPSSHCVFEHVYFSRPDSTIFGRSVEQSRQQMGRILAREAPAAADCVVPVPDSGVAAALGYATESGLPFRTGLIRNHYVGRTFIEPRQSIRSFGVKLKLNPVRHLIEGQRVILVDDSLVRGTTRKKIVSLMRDFGAKEIHLRISCPPTLAPCYYGVDTPETSELIAANHSIDEIRDYTGADSVAYLSLEGLKKAVSANGNGYCFACYTGEYPTDLGGIEQLGNDRRQVNRVG